MFIDRKRELTLLEQQYRSGQAALFVLYGRRRVGKTELLRAFCQDKPTIFHVADLGTESSALAESTGDLRHQAIQEEILLVDVETLAVG